jgi:hypothetical protein
MQPTIESTPDAARPIGVTRAVQFLLASLAIGLIASVVRVAQLATGATLVVALLLVLAFFGVYLLFIRKIAAGKNWARIVFLLLVVLGLPFAVPTYMAELRRSVLSGSVSVVVAILQLIGTGLLFTKSSNLWFRRRK